MGETEKRGTERYTAHETKMNRNMGSAGGRGGGGGYSNKLIR